MATVTFTSSFNSDVALNGLISSLTDAPTYVFVADGVSDVVSPADANVSTKSTATVLNSIVFGKKIIANNLIKMITKNTWTSNTVYAMYDDQDSGLDSKTFFVINSSRSVYKCLYNDGNTAANVEPTSLDPFPVQLADGYVWQYMYRLTVNQLQTQATASLIPVHEDEDVTANAVPGSIDILIVSNSGEDYSAIANGTVQQVVSNTVIRLQNDLSTTNGMYTNSSLYIDSGPGVGQISEISGYVSNSSGRYVTLASSFANVSISSTYIVSPTIKISGDGSDAVARVVMDQQTVGSIEVLSPGSGYTYATASIYANTVYGSNATARPIVSPIGGHGSDVSSELFARHLLVSVNIDGDEIETIPTDVQFSQYGLIQAVKQAANTAAAYTANTFDNTVLLETVQINGTYDVGDTIEAVLDANTVATVVYADADTVRAVYKNTDQFSVLDNIVSQDGVAASIVTVESQPNIYLKSADILMFGNINTVTRSANTVEAFNIILRV